MLQFEQRIIGTALMARCERRIRFLDFEVRRLGTAMALLYPSDPLIAVFGRRRSACIVIEFFRRLSCGANAAQRGQT